MKTIALFFTLTFTTTHLFAQERPAYVIYTADGKRSDYGKMLEEALNNQVILFGEYHNDPVMHWLQAELTRDVIAKKGANTVLGAEMFEADNQVIINEYLSGKISDKSFEAEAKLWPNYKTDYKPLVEMAKSNGIPFIATNVPRRYANIVYKEGTDGLKSLSKESTGWMAPIPFPYDSSVKCYSDMVMMSGGHGGQNLPLSQALKDATMAHFIKKNLGKDKVFIHYNSTYHSDRKEGIGWYLQKEKPVKLMNIAAMSAADPTVFNDEWKGSGDFILVTSETMTKTH